MGTTSTSEGTSRWPGDTKASVICIRVDVYLEYGHGNYAQGETTGIDEEIGLDSEGHGLLLIEELKTFESSLQERIAFSLLCLERT